MSNFRQFKPPFLVLRSLLGLVQSLFNTPFWLSNLHLWWLNHAESISLVGHDGLNPIFFGLSIKSTSIFRYWTPSISTRFCWRLHPPLVPHGDAPGPAPLISVAWDSRNWPRLSWWGRLSWEWSWEYHHGVSPTKHDGNVITGIDIYIYIYHLLSLYILFP